MYAIVYTYVYHTFEITRAFYFSVTPIVYYEKQLFALMYLIYHVCNSSSILFKAGFNAGQAMQLYVIMVTSK